MKPRLSIHLVNFAAEPPGDWQRLFDLAVAADRAGIGRLVVSDHVAFGERIDRYADPALGGLAGGRQPTGPDGAWLEPLTVLAMVGALTERVRLCPMILLAALRRPIVLAKTAATIDVLTGGRLDLGVGVGWQQEEYEAAGLDFAARGRLLDHTLEVCHALWTEERASISTEELSFEGIHQMPKPTAGTVPVWGQRHRQPAFDGSPGPLRIGLDPVGTRRSRHRFGHRQDARGGGRHGTGPVRNRGRGEREGGTRRSRRTPDSAHNGRGSRADRRGSDRSSRPSAIAARR